MTMERMDQHSFESAIDDLVPNDVCHSWSMYTGHEYVLSLMQRSQHLFPLV